MENLSTIATVIAGLFFSLMCALLLEELIFGGLFHFFFAQRSARSQANAQAGPKA